MLQTEAGQRTIHFRETTISHVWTILIPSAAGATQVTRDIQTVSQESQSDCHCLASLHLKNTSSLTSRMAVFRTQTQFRVCFIFIFLFFSLEMPLEMRHNYLIEFICFQDKRLGIYIYELVCTSIGSLPRDRWDGQSREYWPKGMVERKCAFSPLSSCYVIGQASCSHQRSSHRAPPSARGREAEWREGCERELGENGGC